MQANVGFSRPAEQARMPPQLLETCAMSLAKSAFALVALAGLLAPPALADDCGPVFDAMIKAAKTPHTATVTRTEDGKPVTSKMVQTNDRKYIEVNGQWRWIEMPADLDQELEAMRKNTKMTCQKLGSEEVNGQPTTVYTAHVENEGSVSDNELWLGAGGLPLKVRNTVEGKSFSSILDYKHVQAPANATPFHP